MSVADEYGFDDPGSPLLAEARTGWERWCATDPRLAVVDDLTDLRSWTQQAGLEDRVTVLRELAKLTASDRSAVAVLVWLLIPGACRVAEALGDLSPDIDALVASELWVQASQAHRLRTPWIARALLNATRRHVAGQLGVGHRCDRTWRQVHLAADLTALAQSIRGVDPGGEASLDAAAEFDAFVGLAIADGAVDEDQVTFLHDLAIAADAVDAPSHRGRLGLTTPAAVELVARDRPQAARTLRRRASQALDQLRAYAASGTARVEQVHADDPGAA